MRILLIVDDDNLRKSLEFQFKKEGIETDWCNDGKNDIRKQHHSGLGLSIANQLISDHKETISVQDIPSGGSTFIVTL